MAHVENTRPHNRARSLLHVASALFALLLIQTLDPAWLPWVAGAFCAWGWSMEILRRHSALFNRFVMWVFGPVAHAHEREEVNSATWYTTALFGLSMTGSPLLCSIGVVVLGFADPAAALVGRRFGRIRIAAGRTLEGSGAFVIAGVLAAWGTLALFYPDLGVLEAWALAGGAALAGAVAEILARKVDDNFAIPLAAAAGAAIVSVAF